MSQLTRSIVLKSAKKRQTFRALFLVLSLLLIFVGGNAARPTTAAPLLTCADITEIPASECQALQAFVTANPTAGVLASWFQTNAPCDWSGINCNTSNKITELNLSGSQLIALPIEIENLSNLTGLYLENNQLTSIPTEIGNLTNLTGLGLINNDLAIVPASIRNLTNLIYLGLSDNQLATLPAEIGNLTNLTRLDLWSNQLTALPTEIGNLTQLTELYLQINPLLTGPLPNSLLTLSLDKFAYNSTNLCEPTTSTFQSWLVAIPNRLGTIPCSSFTVTCTNITEISAEECQVLQTIVTKNPISTLATQWFQTNTPCDWSGISCDPSNKITELNLSDTQLVVLPTEIGNLTNLIGLYLENNQLTTIPTEIGNLSNLAGLGVINNDLSVIPVSIGNLTNLVYLGLSDNQLATLPAEIGNLINLTRLDIWSNQLTMLPNEIGNLTKLTELYLQINPSLSGPLPDSFLTLRLSNFYYNSTNLCEPTNPTFQSWLTEIPTRLGTIACASHEGDNYEVDDNCSMAKPISTDGFGQDHNFHQMTDTDWMQFPFKANTSYVVDGYLAAGSSADLIVELYEQCGDIPLVNQGNSFSPNILIDFKSTKNGTIYLKVSNENSSAGEQTSYHLSVREVREETAGGVIIMAGLLKNNDLVQPNIDEAAMRIYRLFLQNGYTHERIYFMARNLYLDPDNDGQADVDALATAGNLEGAIKNWAINHVDAKHPLNLYLMDHGSYDTFYINEPLGQRVNPQELDGWLDKIEEVYPTLKVNLIIEMCRAGSFIDPDLSVSKDEPNRVVIASSGAFNDAYASEKAALFTDHLIGGLDQKKTLASSFQEARDAVLIAKNGIQTPWLDANGDGVPNQPADFEQAAQRGFNIAGSFDSILWPPYIDSAEPVVVTGDRGNIVVTVQDDDTTSDRVWAVVYGPSYQPPAPSDTLVSEILPTLVLVSQGNNQYAAQYTGFDEVGTYRIVVYAQDKDDLQARPYAFEVVNGVPTGVGLAQVETTSAAPTIIVMLLPILFGMSYLFAKKRRA